MKSFLQCLAALTIVGFAIGQEPTYTVTVKDGNPVTGDILLPIDPTLRISAQHSEGSYFGLTVDGVRITCSPQGSIWPSGLIDGQFHQFAIFNGVVGPGGAKAVKALPPGPAGRKRHGFSYTWITNKIQFTQTVEVVPSKPSRPGMPQKRRLDTCRISYLVENKDTVAHDVGVRSNIDILVNNNDGALFSSPETEPGKVLNGVVLQGAKLPKYLHVLERPDLKDPGFVATMSFKFGAKLEGPNKVVLTQLGAVGGAGWEVPAMAAGDSACAIFWETKRLQPGQNREMAYAYGGGIATNPESDGKVSLALGGSLEPGKLFTVSALVEDPVPSQNLTLELPPGIERIEGDEVQPVPAPAANGNSVVLWKGRVLHTGDYEIKVRSSTGITQVKSVSIK